MTARKLIGPLLAVATLTACAAAAPDLASSPVVSTTQSATPQDPARSAHTHVVRSVASDAKGGQTIDLRVVSLRTGPKIVTVRITTYSPVSDQAMHQCGSIRIYLGNRAALSITAKNSRVVGHARQAHKYHAVRVRRPNDRSFVVQVPRRQISSYGPHDVWVAYAAGGGFCAGAQLEDSIPDRGAIQP